MIVYLWKKNKQFKAWVKKNGWKGLVVEFTLGLSLVLSIYFIGRNLYMKTLNSGQNCFCKTDSVFIDRTNYLDQIGFTFTTHKGEQIRYLSPIDVDLKTFNYSRPYTVRYLCDDYTYNELILVDWDKSKYKKDHKGRYLLKK